MMNQMDMGGGGEGGGGGEQETPPPPIDINMLGKMTPLGIRNDRYASRFGRPKGLGTVSKYAGAFAPVVSKMAPFAMYVPSASQFKISSNLMMKKIKNDGGGVMGFEKREGDRFNMKGGILSYVRSPYDRTNRERNMVRSTGGGILGKVQELGQNTKRARSIAGESPIARVVDDVAREAPPNPIPQPVVARRSQKIGPASGLGGLSPPEQPVQSSIAVKTPPNNAMLRTELRQLKSNYESQTNFLRQEQQQERAYFKQHHASDPAINMVNVQDQDRQKRATWLNMQTQAEGKSSQNYHVPKWLGQDKPPYV